MLIEFSVGNYRSFKEPVTFSMVAANLVSKDNRLDVCNVTTVDSELKLLKSAAIYGANASGKSNLANALSFMKWFMINSSRETQSTDNIDVEAFSLSTESENEPSFFELVFIVKGRQYRYGFEATRYQVVSEWLHYVPRKRETKLFKRMESRIEHSKKYDAEGIQKRTRKNALFLSVSAQFNVSIAEDILEWITRKINVISGLHDQSYFNYTFDCLAKGVNKEEILQLVKKMDLSIEDVRVIREPIVIQPEMLPQNMPEVMKKAITNNGEPVEIQDVRTIHKKFDKEGNNVGLETFALNHHESEGTRKLFSLAGLLIKALKDGETLLIDEFDARLHPVISSAIVELFNSCEANLNNAQLVFITHDTNLLNHKIFRRDQIWFTEKNRYGATDLYSLAEYGSVRNDSPFEKDYMKGKYGAVPFVGDLQNLIAANG